MKTPVHLLGTHRVPGTVQNIRKICSCSFRARFTLPLLCMMLTFLIHCHKMTKIFKTCSRTKFPIHSRNRSCRLIQKSIGDVCQLFHLMSSSSETTTSSSSEASTSTSSSTSKTTASATTSATSSSSSSSASPATTSWRSFLTWRSR